MPNTRFVLAVTELTWDMNVSFEIRVEVLKTAESGSTEHIVYYPNQVTWTDFRIQLRMKH